MMRSLSVRCLVAAFLVSRLPSSVSAADPRPVGVIDHRLVSQENWVQPWKADWEAPKIVALLERRGVKAAVVGLETLKDLGKLKSYRAILIPTDECYPDEGSQTGPISQNIAAYVHSGGIFVLPMGAAHCRWRDTRTGAVNPGFQAGQPDFLGLWWQVVGDHAGPGPGLKLAPAGEKLGLPKPELAKPAATYARAATPVGEVYVTNEAGQPCLVATDLGSGAVVHYTGGLPLGPDVRDWLIACYAAILKSGPDVAAVRAARLIKTRVYDLVPVAARAEVGDAQAAGRVAQQITLTGQGDWELAAAATDLSPSPGDLSGLPWTRVKLPNTVQHALFQAGKVPNPWYADNYKKLQSIHKQDWYLRRKFRVPAEWRNRHVRLRFDGLDYFGTVSLDGQPLGTHEGMAGGPTFDITARVKPGQEHELLVRLLHETGPQDMPFAAMKGDVIKSMAVDGASYQWGNRFRSIGIWQPVRLVATGQAYLEAPLVRTDSCSERSAELSAQVTITNVGSALAGVVRARIVDLRANRTVWQEESPQAVPSGISYWERSISLSRPNLWWPNGLGDQPLYRLEIVLQVEAHELDAIGTRFGIRKLELRRNPAPADRPRSIGSVWHSTDLLDVDMMRRADESYRFLFVVNGRPFYAKGVCWLTSDDLLALTPEREGWLAEAARASHVNLFRLNGGCNLFETEQFYDLCDEKGILVWQELPLCWNSGHLAGRSAWRDQLVQTTLRLRQHPSLAVYCGGNEFQPYAAGISPVLGLAREIFAAYDDRPFRMASPGGGTHHAYGQFPDLYSGDPNWYAKTYDAGYNFISEWSFPAFGNVSLLRRVVPAEELARGPVGHDWQKFIQSHPILKDRHSEVDFIGKYSFAKGSRYGDLAKASIPEFVEYTQMAQAEVYGCAFEQWRAHFPHVGGQTVWTYNTMGPVSSWNLIDWFGQPTIAYYAAKRAHEPAHVMARTGFYSWGPGDTFKAEVLVIRDGPERLDDARVSARLLDRHMKPLAQETWTVSVPGQGKPSPAGQIAWTIPPDTPEGCFFLELTFRDEAGSRLSRQAYWLRVLKSLADPEARKKWQSGPVADPVSTAGPWLKPQLEGLPTALEARVLSARPLSADEAEVKVEVRNAGPRPAYPVRLALQPDAYPVLWSDNYFWLAEGETVTVTGTVRLNMKGLDPVGNPPPAKLGDLTVQVSAWNAPAASVKPGK